jgi:hypothetical protein
MSAASHRTPTAFTGLPPSSVRDDGSALRPGNGYGT